uniref:Carbamoyl phosphate synthase small subunit n=1 Tax=Nemalion vermiculare TaxID=935621 RepID=UPI0025798058|nr:Carbamoyl phosphate synthase small subunit [Nemalion vermiculare]WGV34332.1 Carbamoyl phosphate synthase small subunit [Nemalion vermiculare]
MFDTKAQKAILVLEDKTTYYGWSLDACDSAIGEVVFNTGMTGYQEVMTDPSYKGQIVTFTYTEIGNTGINDQDDESVRPSIKGIVTRNLCLESSNWRKNQSLIDYLKENQIAHIYGIDTRALTKHLRKTGTMNGYISTVCLDPIVLQNKILVEREQDNRDIVKQVSTSNEYQFILKTNSTIIYNQYRSQKINQDINVHIIVVDFGVKTNILRNLFKYTKYITVVPSETSSKEILRHKPDGILLSNGPGDPALLTYAVDNVRDLIKTNIPLFGICMGHQILSLAMGFKTFKLKFGHRGLNHPVGYRKQIEITSQNHGFATISNPKLDEDVLINQKNYNDNTIAALCHRKHPSFAVQYHPEASPGPHDSLNLFEHFIRIAIMVKSDPFIVRQSQNKMQS